MINIIDKHSCCGCTACASVCAKAAIKMTPDKEGFLYPIVDYSKCVNCGMCENVCPIMKQDRQIFTRKFEQKFYAARLGNEDDLMSSSSGGISSAVVEKVIKEGGIASGAIYDANMVVKHSLVNNLHDGQKLRGSKYSQSNMSGIFNQIKTFLQKGEKVLFTGTPCQVHGLLCFLRRPYDNLLTIDLICHAVPSPLMFREYISMVEKKHHGYKVINLNMRDKKHKGWGHDFSYKYIFERGKEVIDPIWYKNWGTLYFSKLIDRPSCHSCRYTNYNRVGDITIADFWDDKKIHPEIYCSKGTSLVIINTDKGNTLFNSLSNVIKYTITKNDSWQPCLEKPTSAAPERDKFWLKYQELGFDYVYRNYLKLSWKRIFILAIKKVIKRY